MTTRRNVLKIGAVSAAYGLTGSKASANLVFPDGFVPGYIAQPSPPARPWAAPLNIMPDSVPVPVSDLVPGPDPGRHQRYDEFQPKEFHVHRINEFLWRYHPDPPYDQGSWSWGFNGITPGPTIKTRYGEPCFVRRINDLPPLGSGNVRFALPSTTIHFHNNHTASESDGIPQDYFNPGEYWDHHYCLFPAGFDNREVLGTMWYHDHREDFTAPNVYAGLSGFHLAFDELDSNNERDTNPNAWRLPSGKYDVPLMLHDVHFDQNGQPLWDFFNPEPDNNMLPSEMYTVNGMLGDRITVNRIIQPYLDVEPRKYRFRLLNGGPSRLYDMTMRPERANGQNDEKDVPFFLLSQEGNIFEEPIELEHIEVGIGQRYDVIMDFSQFRPGDHVYLVNRMEMREDGAGPTGFLLDEGDQILRFNVMQATGEEDPSRIPDKLRELPPINFSEVRRERLFVFDQDNGVYTINDKTFDPNRVDARIEEGSAEIWTWRNESDIWAHPIHTHFEEFQLIEKNGRPIPKGDILRSRKDIVMLMPGDEVKLFSRWRDFTGKHVMHCHNVVHEDHAMMLRWDIVPPGEGD